MFEGGAMKGEGYRKQRERERQEAGLTEGQKKEHIQEEYGRGRAEKSGSS